MPNHGRKRFVAALVAASLASHAALAQSPGKTIDDAAEAARTAIEKVLQALGAALSSIPQFETPEILPNGDILIRRKPPAAKPPEPATPDKPQRT